MLNALMKRLLDKETQSLIKAGFLDKELNLTPRGEAEIMAIVLQANRKELFDAAEAHIKEEDGRK